MIEDKRVDYLVCAETIAHGIPSSIRWLGLFGENLPGWTTREKAFRFHTLQSAKDYFDNGRGYTLGIYKPIMETVKVVELETTITVTEIYHSLD